VAEGSVVLVVVKSLAFRATLDVTGLDAKSVTVPLATPLHVGEDSTIERGNSCAQATVTANGYS
jgi:hypothetical protein